MKKKPLSYDAVLERIGAPDFRSISKDQITAFVSALPEMDKETAIKCLEQFPEFATQSIQIVKELRGMFDAAVSDNKNVREETIEAYKRAMSILEQMSMKEGLSLSEQHDIVNRMVDIADKIDDIRKQNESFLRNGLYILGTVGSLAIATAATLLGSKFIKK